MPHTVALLTALSGLGATAAHTKAEAGLEACFLRTSFADAGHTAANAAAASPHVCAAPAFLKVVGKAASDFFSGLFSGVKIGTAGPPPDVFLSAGASPSVSSSSPLWTGGVAKAISTNVTALKASSTKHASAQLLLLKHHAAAEGGSGGGHGSAWSSFAGLHADSARDISDAGTAASFGHTFPVDSTAHAPTAVAAPATGTTAPGAAAGVATSMSGVAVKTTLGSKGVAFSAQGKGMLLSKTAAHGGHKAWKTRSSFFGRRNKGGMRGAGRGNDSSRAAARAQKQTAKEARQRQRELERQQQKQQRQMQREQRRQQQQVQREQRAQRRAQQREYQEQRAESRRLYRQERDRLKQEQRQMRSLARNEMRMQRERERLAAARAQGQGGAPYYSSGYGQGGMRGGTLPYSGYGGGAPYGTYGAGGGYGGGGAPYGTYGGGGYGGGGAPYGTYGGGAGAPYGPHGGAPYHGGHYDTSAPYGPAGGYGWSGDQGPYGHTGSYEGNGGYGATEGHYGGETEMGETYQGMHQGGYPTSPVGTVQRVYAHPGGAEGLKSVTIVQDVAETKGGVTLHHVTETTSRARNVVAPQAEEFYGSFCFMHLRNFRSTTFLQRTFTGHIPEEKTKVVSSQGEEGPGGRHAAAAATDFTVEMTKKPASSAHATYAVASQECCSAAASLRKSGSVVASECGRRVAGATHRIVSELETGWIGDKRMVLHSIREEDEGERDRGSVEVEQTLREKNVLLQIQGGQQHQRLRQYGREGDKRHALWECSASSSRRLVIWIEGQHVDAQITCLKTEPAGRVSQENSVFSESFGEHREKRGMKPRRESRECAWEVPSGESLKVTEVCAAQKYTQEQHKPSAAVNKTTFTSAGAAATHSSTATAATAEIICAALSEREAKKAAGNLGPCVKGANSVVPADSNNAAAELTVAVGNRDAAVACRFEPDEPLSPRATGRRAHNPTAHTCCAEAANRASGDIERNCVRGEEHTVEEQSTATKGSTTEAQNSRGTICRADVMRSNEREQAATVHFGVRAASIDAAAYRENTTQVQATFRSVANAAGHVLFPVTHTTFCRSATPGNSRGSPRVSGRRVQLSFLPFRKLMYSNFF